MSDLTFHIPPAPPFTMIQVPGGSFTMGDELKDLWAACQPLHPVELSDYNIGAYPVTQALWRAVAEHPVATAYGLNPDPSYYKGDQRPVEKVSWDDVTEKFLPALRAVSGNEGFRLPTEAEWEYAARGGPYATDEYLYAGGDRLEDLGWFSGYSGFETHDVGLKHPNQLGIFDMSGNVYEWCKDVWDKKFYQKCLEMFEKTGHYADPCCHDGGTYRVLRGGFFFDDLQNCRAACRNGRLRDAEDRHVGFRLVLPAV